MTKTITITNPMQVKTDDKAYFKGCDFGFTVLDTDGSNPDAPLKIYDPLIGRTCWSHSHRFDHATREIEESEWPDPHGLSLHIYLGADGNRYLYNPCSKKDTEPWAAECSIGFRNRQLMASIFPEAIPLTELELIPKERKS